MYQLRPVFCSEKSPPVTEISQFRTDFQQGGCTRQSWKALGQTDTKSAGWTRLFHRMLDVHGAGIL